MPEVKTHAQLVRDGFAADEIRRLSRTGTLTPVRRGAYVTTNEATDRETAHRRLVEATVAQCGPGVVVSHTSAAVLHGLPVPYADLSRVHLTRNREGGGRARRWVQVHGTPLPGNDVTTVEDVPVTTLARTFVDLGRSLPTATSVAAGDVVLRAGVTRSALAGAVELARGRHGVGAARRALELLDARAESAGESVSRVLMAELGLPRPQPQLVITNGRGEFVARVDFGWPELRVVGEFDGRIKYGRQLEPQRDLSDVLWSEKQREDQIRRLGWLVVRWTWDDLDDVRLLGQRLRAALVGHHLT